MLAPTQILDQLKARLVETLDALPLLDGGNRDGDDDCALVSVILSLPRVPTGAPQLDGRQFQFLHGHGTEIRAGYGCAAEWEAEGS